MKFGIVYYWGDPVEIFDLAEDFLELRIFEDDINDNYRTWKSKLDPFLKDWDNEITIHMPEYFTNPATGKSTLVDLASTNENILKWSLKIMESLVNFANSINATKLIIHPGGITRSVNEIDHDILLKQLKNTLTEIYGMHFQGELLVENMPWFYWRNDGTRWYSNICISPDDFSELLEFSDGIVLDLSHGYLCTSKGSNKNLETFARKFKDKIYYLHVSDGLPPDNEGLQVGEGNINFSGIFNMLDKKRIMIVPEIWKGHENFGEGFKIAIENINHLI